MNIHTILQIIMIINLIHMGIGVALICISRDTTSIGSISSDVDPKLDVGLSLIGISFVIVIIIALLEIGKHML